MFTRTAPVEESLTPEHALLADHIGNEVYASHYAERKAYRLILAWIKPRSTGVKHRPQLSIKSLIFRTMRYARIRSILPLCSLELVAYYWRNDYMGVEQYSRYIDGANYVFVPALYEQHRKFAALWDKNLHAQGFLEVFTDQCIRG